MRKKRIRLDPVCKHLFCSLRVTIWCMHCWYAWCCCCSSEEKILCIRLTHRSTHICWHGGENWGVSHSIEMPFHVATPVLIQTQCTSQCTSRERDARVSRTLWICYWISFHFYSSVFSLSLAPAAWIYSFFTCCFFPIFLSSIVIIACFCSSQRIGNVIYFGLKFVRYLFLKHFLKSSFFYFLFFFFEELFQFVQLMLGWYSCSFFHFDRDFPNAWGTHTELNRSDTFGLYYKLSLSKC